MTIKEAILTSLDDLKNAVTYTAIYEHIVQKNYYEFIKAKTPKDTISALLGDFIRNEDTRVKRIKREGRSYLYYLSKYEQDIISITEDEEGTKTVPTKSKKESYSEKSLHTLLSTYLNSINIFSKTILHEKSSNNSDNHQKWIHPDMIGINLISLQTKVTQQFLKTLNTSDTFKLTSYEVKREINTDYELKKTYFQAVSNSSWANYGYLVALEISGSLKDEMERLNQSFGIGIIELKANPFESKVLFPAKYKDLDFKTIDKLCKVNKDFVTFIDYVEKILTADDRYLTSSKKELTDFCDKFLSTDTQIEEYCKKENIIIDTDY